MSDAQQRVCPMWSRDGRRLAYLWTRPLEKGKTDEALALWNLDNGEEQRIGFGKGESEISSLFPCDWSPDGQALTASSIPKPPNMSLGLWSLAAAPHAEWQVDRLRCRQPPSASRHHPRGDAQHGCDALAVDDADATARLGRQAPLVS